MSKKIEKLKEINESVAKRCADLETYMFIKNIINIPVCTNNDKVSKVLVETK